MLTSVRAIILIIGIGGLATYTGYIIGQFRERYPHIQSMADAGEVLLGAVGREIMGTGQLLLLVFIMASHILTFTVAMNTITEHGTCSIVFGVVSMVISWAICLPRAATKLSYLSVACRLPINAGLVIVCMINS